MSLVRKIADLAARIAVELKPKKIFSPSLKIM